MKGVLSKMKGASSNMKGTSSYMKGSSSNIQVVSPNVKGTSSNIEEEPSNIEDASSEIKSTSSLSKPATSNTKDSKPKKKSRFPFSKNATSNTEDSEQEQKSRLPSNKAATSNTKDSKSKKSRFQCFKRKKQKVQVEQVMTSGRNKTSLSSASVHRVYDLNENTEKIMEINLSDDETSGSDTSSAHSQIAENEVDATDTVDQTLTNRNHSPPKLETPIYQLRVPRPSTDREKSRTLSSSSYTKPLSTCREQKLQGSWSGSHTPTGTSSNSESSHGKWLSHGNKFSRDLAWAEKVVTKHRLRLSNSRHSASGTDVTSEILPRPRRH